MSVVGTEQGPLESVSSFAISSLSIFNVQVEEESLDGKHLVVSCTVSFNKNNVI